MPAVLSVIIPTYNIAPYLRPCLDSVVNQTYPHLEIIIIDDNSTDVTPEIIKEYAARDGRIKPVFHTANAGPGNTRNEGLTLATGDYVTFMDHDDWQELDKYEKMIARLEQTDADFVVCDAQEYNQSRGAFFTKPWGKNLRKKTQNQPFHIEHWAQKAVIINGYTAPWAKIVRRNMVEEHNICFSGGGNKSDDVLFHYHVCMVSKTFAYVPEALYTHRFFPTSISGQWREGGDAMIVSRLDTWADIQKLCTKYGTDPKLPFRYFIKKLAIYSYRADNSRLFVEKVNKLINELGMTEDDFSKPYRKYYRNIRKYSPLRRGLVQGVRRLKLLVRPLVLGK